MHADQQNLLCLKINDTLLKQRTKDRQGYLGPLSGPNLRSGVASLKKLGCTHAKKARGYLWDK